MVGTEPRRRPGSDGLRVVHLIDSGGFFGAEQVIVTLAAEQQSRGTEVTIATIVAPQDEANPIAGVAKTRGLRVKEFLMNDGLNVTGRSEILEWLAAGKIDVLHCHGSKVNILMALVPKRNRNCHYITSLHGWTSTGKWRKHAIVELVERLLLFRFDAVCFVSESMVTRVPRVVRRQLHCHVVPNGVSIRVNEADLPNDIERFAAGRRIVVAVGRLSVEKDFNMLLRAMSVVLNAISDVCVVIVGEGAQRNELVHLAEELSIADSVMLAGYRNNPREWLAHCDVFALSSVTEGLPMVLLEAMLAKLPIAATRVGELPVVLDGLSIPLTEPRDHVTLAGRIRELLTSDITNADRMSLRHRVDSKYSNRVMADAYDKVYRDVQERAAA